MSDAHALLSSLRDEVSTLDQRRAELRQELEAVDRDHEQLATTISVVEARVGAAPDPGLPPDSEDVPLTERIADRLGPSGLRRRELLRIFEAQGFTAAAIDSAVTRLLKRGVAGREGRRVVRIAGPSVSAETAASDSRPVRVAEPGPEPMSGPATVERERDDSSAAGCVSDSASGEGVADDAGRHLTDRVRDAVHAGVDSRRALLKYFASRGVKASSLDHAISGLRTRGVLDRLPNRKLAVAVGSSERAD